MQIGVCAMNYLTKFSVNDGMNPFILVTYRQGIATLVLVIPCIVFERNAINGLSKRVLLKLLLCSILGVTLNNALFSLGLKYSTTTVASAINNIHPALTFLASALFRIENVKLKSATGYAKILGTVLSVGGAMIISFYSGFQINVQNPSYDFSYLNGSSTPKASVVGPLLVAFSCLARCGWFLLQKGLNEDFPYPITSTAAASLLASVQCAIVGLCMGHGSGWSLHSKLRLVSIFYNGVFGSAIAYLISSYFIAKKGPVFVSMFNPVSMVLVAVLGWAFLKEKLFFGSLLGSGILLVGLICVIWANWMEEIHSRRSKTSAVELESGVVHHGDDAHGAEQWDG